MSLETQFNAVNTIALVAWIFLWILPRSRMTEKVVLSGFACLVLSALYAVKVVAVFGFPDLQKVQSLEGVMAIFANPEAMLVAWIHFLTFNLAVGLWMTRDARRLEVPHVFVLLPLVLTFLLGPLGLLLYAVLRAFWRKNPGLASFSR